MTVRVVTDSTAYLPDGFAARYGVDVVPLHVVVDGRSLQDGVDFGPADLVDAMRARHTVTTSRPNPDQLAERYRAALADGASEVVSVHLSRELSGTWEAARSAAAQVDGVRVVDSRTTVMGMGFAVLAAAAAASAGASGAEVERVAVRTAARTATWFSVPTLEYLRRGGRIGTAAALVGTALSVKPLLHMADGQIVALEKVRTTARATARLVDLAAGACDGGAVGGSAVGGSAVAGGAVGGGAVDGHVRLAVHHLGAQDRAAELADQLAGRLPEADGVLITEVGAVIGAHTGPGLLGVVVLPG